MIDVTRESDRINKNFRQLAERIQCAVVGYPNMRRRQNLVEVLVQAGADIIELGVPFSDPVANGPIIQEAYCHSCPVTTILNTYNLCFHYILNQTLVLL